jgi:hypothetical protein
MTISEFMDYLHDVHDMNTYRVDHVWLSTCPAICMIQLKNCWTDFDEIYYGCYAIEVYPNIVLYNSLQLVKSTW